LNTGFALSFASARASPIAAANRKITAPLFTVLCIGEPPLPQDCIAMDATAKRLGSSGRSPHKPSEWADLDVHTSGSWGAQLYGFARGSRTTRATISGSREHQTLVVEQTARIV
jgi:hypothetical protein